MQLIKYDAARQALAEARNFDEVKNIKDQAIALEAYARQTHNVEMEIWIAEIKLRAIRRMGEITKNLDISKGGKNSNATLPSGGRVKKELLKEAGITTQEASRCERIADKDEEDLELYIQRKNEKNEPVTVNDVLKNVKTKENKKKLKKKQADNKKKDSAITFKHKPYIFHENCGVFFDRMSSADLLITDPPYSTDIKDINQFVNDWLPPTLELLKDTARAYVCIGAYPIEIQAYLNALTHQDKFIVDNPLIWTYRNTLGVTPKMKYNLNYQIILHLYTAKSRELDTSITNEMFSVQDINAPDGRQGDRYHSWQKPNELANRLIRHSTVEGENVIDPFAGTGTFLIAAAKNGCMAVGCDIDGNAIDIAVERGCERG
jgi:DNA modification methylase